MSQLDAFPITRKWPAAHPDRLQLYSLPTPNGVKVSIMLEEIGLPYEAHLVSFERNDSFPPSFFRSIPITRYPPFSTRMAPAASRWACLSPAPFCCIWRRKAVSCCRLIRRAAMKPCSG